MGCFAAVEEWFAPSVEVVCPLAVTLPELSVWHISLFYSTGFKNADLFQYKYAAGSLAFTSFLFHFPLVLPMFPYIYWWTMLQETMPRITVNRMVSFRICASKFVRVCSAKQFGYYKSSSAISCDWSAGDFMHTSCTKYCTIVVCVVGVEQHISGACERVWLYVWETVKWSLDWLDGHRW